MYVPGFEDCWWTAAFFCILTAPSSRAIGHCSRGRNERIQGPERGLHGHHRVSCSPSAAVPSDADHHRCREELHDRLPPAHRHVARHCGGKTLSRRGQRRDVPFLSRVEWGPNQPVTCKERGGRDLDYPSSLSFSVC